MSATTLPAPSVAATPSRRQLRVWAVLVTVALLPWIWLPGLGSSAVAAFGDPVSAASSFGAATIAKPGSPTCSHALGLGVAATASWTTVPGATGYVVVLNGVTQSPDLPPTATSWSVLLALNSTVTVQTRVGTWTSAPVTYLFPALSPCSVP